MHPIRLHNTHTHTLKIERASERASERERERANSEQWHAMGCLSRFRHGKLHLEILVGDVHRYKDVKKGQVRLLAQRSKAECQIFIPAQGTLVSDKEDYPS